MSDQSRIAVAEAIGTMILVLGGPGTAILATGTFSPSGTVGVLGVALAFGLAMLVAVYAVGSISGCHINPAVTVGLWAVGKTKAADIPYYVTGQIVGAVAGGGIIFAIANSIKTFNAQSSNFAANGWGSHSPGGFDLPAVILAELVLTALFVFVIASTTRRSMPAGLGGVTIGLTLALIHLISIPIDNTSVNPARSLATAILQHGWAMHQLWIFILVPIGGGMIGAVAWRLLVPADDAGPVAGGLGLSPSAAAQPGA